MLNADPLKQRPTLVHTALLARALEGLRPEVTSPVEIWQRLTERYVVDLDAVAALLPADEPETQWLPARD
ncbi:hypothetical protein SAMN02799622_03707 [Methylobacterium sp. UNC378MF]|jgi:hypothetical protein|uniref:hypothetical protein n=1 Tax=unclassified Methylobacterium TaxID=2615210 RepID=UPI000889CFA2|nr:MULTISPECIES: hypothetical protein [unclassified Methylobacterium]KAA0125566.1 hypothetical protein CIW48_00195 [Methylobacterium sp. P1-11]SDA25935.1 hypothetical protein SAMN02799622_03707 [Methylobacterium sp. UNC378MF]